jgi:hypothetical protein
MPEAPGEVDDVTLRVLAIMDGTTLAEQRREAVRDYARRARQDKDVAEIVRLILASRREHQGRVRGNVIEIGARP